MTGLTHPLESLASAARVIARSVKGRRGLRSPTSAEECRDILHGERSTMAQRAVALEYLVVHADVPTTTKLDECSFLLFRLRMRQELSPGERMAIVKAALMLTRDHSRKKWVRQLRDEYEQYQAKGLRPDWAWFCMDSSQVEALFARVRSDLKMPTINLDDPVRSATDFLEVDRSSSALKIVKLSLAGFRSVPGSLDVATVNHLGHPASIVISGDNGTGKSSLVSAIEFATQGSIGRSIPGDSLSAFTPVSLRAADGAATAGVLFNDGSVAVRRVERDGTVSGDARLPDFSMTPISLQRADLIQFLETRPEVRGQLFVGMLGTDSTDPAVRDAEQRLKLARARRISVLQEAARSLPRDETGRLNVHQRLSQTYLSGLTRREWEARRRVLPQGYLDLIGPIVEAEEEANAAKRHFKKVAQESNLNYPRQVKRLAGIVGDLSGPMTDSVKTITGYGHFERIEVQIGAPVLGVTLRVHLADGTSIEPERLFSEGVQDLIAILFFLEIAHAAAERGQAKILILDDVIQSVDAGIRVRLMEYVATRFSKWQLFITCHDKLWREQVRTVLRAANHSFGEVEIRRWSYESGPQLVQSPSGGDPSTSLRHHVDRSSPSVIAGQAGRLLETICDRLSWTLPVAVVRNKTDRYDLGALWPPVLKKLKASSIAGVLEPVASSLYLRNLIGAHYNEFAESVPDQAADQFGTAVLSLWDSVWCSTCGQWVERKSQGACQCRCGATSFTY